MSEIYDVVGLLFATVMGAFSVAYGLSQWSIFYPVGATGAYAGILGAADGWNVLFFSTMVTAGTVYFIVKTMMPPPTESLDDVYPIGEASERELQTFLAVDGKGGACISTTEHFKLLLLPRQVDRELYGFAECIAVPFNIPDVLYVRAFFNENEPTPVVAYHPEKKKTVYASTVGAVGVVIRFRSPDAIPQIAIYARNGWSGEELVRHVCKTLFSRKEC